MGLTDYPIMFDTTQILRPIEWNEKSEVVENVMTTEGGTDFVEVVRYDKLTISAKFGVTGAWAKVFKEFSKHDTIDVKIYDIETQAYKTRVMRMRSFAAKLRKNSELLPAVNGVWTVSFTLKEL